VTYPLQFRPSGLCNTFDASGTVLDTGVSLQIMKPLLSCRFNVLPAEWDYHNPPGGILARFVIQSDLLAGQLIGPSEWKQPQFPYFVRVEDPNAEKWFVHDALPWDDPGMGQQLVAGFASKSLLIIDNPVAAPAGAIAPAYTAPRLFPEVLYTVNLPLNDKRYWVVPLLPGQGATFAVLSHTAGLQPIVIKLTFITGLNTVQIASSGVAGEFCQITPAAVSVWGSPILVLELTNQDIANAASFTFIMIRSRALNQPSIGGTS